MTEITPPPNTQSRPVPRLSAVFATTPTLPGESAEEYEHGLQSLIEELEAQTVMQVYLAEKIFECLWWMRRYEQQKRATIAYAMTQLLTDTETYNFTAREYNVMDIILDPTRREELDVFYKVSGHTEQSLLQEALSNKSASIDDYNKQITVLAKTLSGFQASYEVLSNRRLNIERLRLQNELLQKDLSSIEIEALPDASQSEKKSGQ